MASSDQQNANKPRSTPTDDMRFVVDVLGHSIFNPMEVLTAVGPTLSELTCGLLGHRFRPERDIPDLSRKTIFVTGGESPRRDVSLSKNKSDIDTARHQEILDSVKRPFCNWRATIRHAFILQPETKKRRKMPSSLSRPICPPLLSMSTSNLFNWTCHLSRR